MARVGEELVRLLEKFAVEVVFGIPGVHTVELYRGLSDSSIRHITPRHEQGAGFMADGYARTSGNPGVCLVITGPGLTNMITPMAQARADSVPMIVISSVNSVSPLGKDIGRLHELPDQSALMRSLIKFSHTLEDPDELYEILTKAYAAALSGRPGPVHIEIPVDVLAAQVSGNRSSSTSLANGRLAPGIANRVAELCALSERPAILAGGGARSAAAYVTALSTKLDAPVVETANARGICRNHHLGVPFSPCLKPVRSMLEDSDLVIAVGTEFGETDYDIYKENIPLKFRCLVRIDSCDQQLAKGPKADIKIHCSAKTACLEILSAVNADGITHSGIQRADTCRRASLELLGPEFGCYFDILQTIQNVAGECVVVGDSTQLSYAGNLHCNASRVGGWFNSATGFGALGYAPAAAVGASIGLKNELPVICIVGDGGIQFTLGELGTAASEKASVIYLIWNNRGYGEIESYMKSKGIDPLGTDPAPPCFNAIANAYGLPYRKISKLEELSEVLSEMLKRSGPSIVEWIVLDEGRT